MTERARKRKACEAGLSLSDGKKCKRLNIKKKNPEAACWQPVSFQTGWKLIKSEKENVLVNHSCGLLGLHQINMF